MHARARSILVTSASGALVAGLVVLSPTAAHAQSTPPGPNHALPSVTLPTPGTGAPTKVAYANDHVLVRFRTGTSATAQAHVLSAAGSAVDTTLRGGYVAVDSPKGATAS